MPVHHRHLDVPRLIAVADHVQLRHPAVEGGGEAVLGDAAGLRREVLPWAADAWYRPDSVKVGYEISFNRYFYRPQPMRTLEEIRADILALEEESAGLLDDVLATASSRAGTSTTW